MIAKTKLKKEAILLRREGNTYGEILKKVPVAKSTLSLWLRDVGLAKKQVQRITEKRRSAQLRGGAKRREVRIAGSQRLIKESKSEIGRITSRDLFLIGVALYWAEGTKQKTHNVSQGLELINDDYKLLKVFLVWLHAIQIDRSRIVFEIYLHEASRNREKEVIQYWTRQLQLPRSTRISVYFKRHKTRGLRRKPAEEYFGSLRIRVRASTDLNRQIRGWIDGIIENCQIV
jgi:hypothetical protein